MAKEGNQIVVRDLSKSVPEALVSRMRVTHSTLHMYIHIVVFEVFAGRWLGVLSVSRSHLEAFVCLFCDPAIRAMCTVCPHGPVAVILGQESSASCGLSLPAE